MREGVLASISHIGIWLGTSEGREFTLLDQSPAALVRLGVGGSVVTAHSLLTFRQAMDSA